MNLDFKLPMTGKVARRLAYLNSIIPINMDPRVMNHVTRDLLDPQHIHQSIKHTSLKQQLNAKELEIIQFVDDTNYRAILGGLIDLDTIELTLISALTSGRKLVILDDHDSVMWEEILPKFGIEYVTVVDPLQPIDAPIVLVKNDSTLLSMKQHARDRILVFVPHHYDFDLFSRNDETYKLYSAKNRIQYTLENLAKEFPYCVMGFYLDPNAPITRIKHWASQTRVMAMIEAINCDKRVGRALEMQPANQITLNQAGFKRHKPEWISKILNVNVDMIVDRSYIIEEENAEG